jgi:transcriptional regulator with XRE-family HTH domain
MSPIDRSQFAARLRELREQASMTQAQLAERAGIHLSAVTRIEHGLRTPGLETAGKLAGALGVRVDDLLSPPEVDTTLKRPRGRPMKAAKAKAPPKGDPAQRRRKRKAE